MKEGNEVIALWLGWEKYGNAYKCPNVYPIENSYTSGWTTFTPDQLEFNVRWDWLMPVVAKIRSLLKNNDLYAKAKDLWDFICTALSTVEIGAVRIAVLRFIEWYNKQGSPTPSKVV